MIELETLAKFLDITLKAEQFAEDVNGVYQHSTQPIHRLGLILEPWSELPDWVCSKQIDALFCHRPWKLELNQLPLAIGILAYHLSFDEALTVGYNPFLANSLRMTELKVLGTKSERPIGMIGEISTQTLERYIQRVKNIFDGIEDVVFGSEQVSRVAVVGAMSAELIQMAADRQAELYITGQLRRSAESAIQATGISVIEIGHHRSEKWGLRALAQILRQQWSALEVILPDSMS